MSQAICNIKLIFATVAGAAALGSSVSASALRIPASTSFASPWVRNAPGRALSLQEAVTDLRDNGLPVAAIADLAKVERKTVYSWLGGSAVPRQEHQERVMVLHRILKESFGGNYRVLHRVWKSPAADGTTLRDLLTSEHVDVPRLRTMLANMSTTIARYARMEAAQTPVQKRSRSNPVIDESPVVDIG